MEYFKFILTVYDVTIRLVCVLGVLMLIIFIHEIGHYLVARVCGISASVFSIGFGPEIYGFVDKVGTRWRLAVIPLGGYVRFIENQDVTGSPSELQTQEKIRQDSFAAASAWKRAATVFSGPFFNVMFTVFVMSVLFFSFGRTVVIPVVTDVIPNSPAAQAGFRAGDKFLTMQGTPVSSFEEISNYIMIHEDDPVYFTVLREGYSLEMIVTPRLERIEDGFGHIIHVGRIGIVSSSNPDNTYRINYDLFEAIRQSMYESSHIILQTGRFISRLIQGREDRCQLSGPVRTAQIAWKTSSFGFLALLYLSAFLSINVGLFNLLPIPPLDGGHLFFYLVEGIAGRAIPLRIQTMIFRIGFILVLFFMIFTILNNYISC